MARDRLNADSIQSTAQTSIPLVELVGEISQTSEYATFTNKKPIIENFLHILHVFCRSTSLIRGKILVSSHVS